LGEAFFILLLIVAVSHASEVVEEGWQSFGKMILSGHARDDAVAGTTAVPEPASP
jgi:hypothetical protein